MNFANNKPTAQWREIVCEGLTPPMGPSDSIPYFAQNVRFSCLKVIGVAELLEFYLYVIKDYINERII